MKKTENQIKYTKIIKLFKINKRNVLTNKGPDDIIEPSKRDRDNSPKDIYLREQ